MLCAALFAGAAGRTSTPPSYLKVVLAQDGVLLHTAALLVQYMTSVSTTRPDLPGTVVYCQAVEVDRLVRA